MKNIITITLFLLIHLILHSQIKKPESYTGNLVDEYVWSSSKNEYLLLESNPMSTKIALTEAKIIFKKGDSEWLKNDWIFDKKEQYPNGKIYDRYSDEREQQILIDHENKEILYYYNYDIHKNTFLNIAIYRNLIKNNKILDELFNGTKVAQSERKILLTKDAFLRSESAISGENLGLISSGTELNIIGKIDDFYQVEINGKNGFINDFFFRKTELNEENNLNVAKKEIKLFYKDGKAFQYYTHNGISITMHLSIERNYGKYYVAHIALENFTGDSFHFNPHNIKALFKNKERESNAVVLTKGEFLKKVNNRQAWNSALVAFGESYTANQAGYSSSTTTSTTSGVSNSYGSVSGYYGNTYGSFYGNSSTYGTSTTISNTTTYNPTANYIAQQNAQQNINEYQNQQYQVKKVLDDGYLKINTIENEQRIFGQINIKYKKSDQIRVIVPVNGIEYEFLWNN